MATQAGCDFCSIVAGNSPARVVHEDTSTVAFFPLNPASRGHTLVIPKIHVPDVFELTDDAAAKLAVSVLRVARGVRRAMHASGMNIITSAGAAAQQTVRHLHVHVVPRQPGDRMGDIWPEDQAMPDDEADRLQAAVRAALEAAEGA
jgi:histidine triad (HIT) family protein